MATRIEIQRRLAVKKEALMAAEKAYIALLNGQVQSYTIDNRELTKFDLPKLEETISRLENEVDSLENQLKGGARRRTVAVIPRDF